MSKKESKVTVFLPANAKLNWGNQPSEPPPVQYEKTKTQIGRDAYKKVVKDDRTI